MSFPVRIRGSVALPTVAVDGLPERVMVACVDQFEHEGAKVTSDTPLAASFYVPIRMLERGQWLTTSIESGTIDITPTADGGFVLTYQLSLWRVVLFMSFAAPILFGLIGHAPWEMTVLLWLLVVGGNYVHGTGRARFWFRQRIADASEVTTKLAQGEA